MGFCEGEYGGLFRGIQRRKGTGFAIRPEYGNSISAFATVICGIHWLVFFDDGSHSTFLLGSLMVVNGIGSFGMHYGLEPERDWNRLDEHTMMLGMLIVYACVWQTFIGIVVKKFHMCRDEGLKVRTLNGLGWLCSIAVGFWCIERNLDSVLPFALSFSASLCLLIAIICMGCEDHTYVAAQVRAKAIRYFFFGLASVVLAFACWFVAEVLCTDDSADFFKLFPGHIVWHVASSYGLLHMWIFVAFLRAHDLQQRPEFFKGKYFSIMPGFYIQSHTPLEELCPRIWPEVADHTEIIQNMPGFYFQMSTPVEAMSPPLSPQALGHTEIIQKSSSCMDDLPGHGIALAQPSQLNQPDFDAPDVAGA